MILFNLKQEKKKQGQNDLAFFASPTKGNITYFESLNRGVVYLPSENLSLRFSL